MAAAVLLRVASAGAGLVVLSGDDSDDHGHCAGASCGGLYPQMLRAMLAASGGSGRVLALGVGDTGEAGDSLDAWNDPANGGPGAPVTRVSGPAISTVDLSAFSILYVPSDAGSTEGGITNADIGRLNAREADVAHFVNVLGGSLLALTEAAADTSVAFRWLPFPLTFVPVRLEMVAPTPDLLSLVPAATPTAENMTHCCYHNGWSGPVGLSGLKVLVAEQETDLHVPIVVGGRVLVPERCGNGIDDDGDGLVDAADPDCSVCGNGVVEPGEECDPGAATSGCCSPTCRLEPDGTACGDGNACNGPETCRAGACVAGPPPDCDDRDRCTTDACNPGSGCTHAILPGCCDVDAGCDDGNPCTTDVCRDGFCAATPVADGTPCSDADVCNGEEACTAGVCAAPSAVEALACLSTHLVAFVGNFDDDSLSLIPAGSGAVSATVPTGAGPWGIAVHPGGAEVYVSARDGATVSVLDALTGAPRASIAVGSTPLGVIVDRAGARVYVASYDQDRVDVVDVATRAVVATVAVGSGPSGLVFDAGGDRLYVSNYAADTLSVIDTAATAVVATVPTGHRPLQMGLDTVRGRLYVVNYEDESVTVVGTVSNSVLATIPVGVKPFGVAVDAMRARAYVTNASSDTVSVIATDTNTVVTTIPVGRAPLGIGLDLEGKVAFVANGLGANVAVVDTLAGAVTRTLSVGSQPVAFGPFLGPVGGGCRAAALGCDDGDPFTTDSCAPAGGCQHTRLGGVDAVRSGLAALDASVRSASAGALGTPRTARVLGNGIGGAAELTPDQTLGRRALRGRLGEIDRRLKRVLHVLDKGLRKHTIDADLGLRLLDVARATHDAVRSARRATRG